jgi:phosphoserine phosphatase RsbU/P
MGSPRVPERSSAGRRTTVPPALPQGAEAPVSTRQLLLHSWPGRLFIISTALKLVVVLARAVFDVAAWVGVLSTAATIGLIVSVVYFTWRLFVLVKRRLLWRVRRKLILSYIFIGVVPALLIVIFFLLSGVLIFMNVSAYLFKDGYDTMTSFVTLATEAAASEIARTSEVPAQTLNRVHRNASKQYRALSLAYVPAGESGQAPITVGAWRHTAPPTSMPPWLKRQEWSGSIGLPSRDSPGEIDLVIRTAVPVMVDGKPTGYVIGDLPIDDETVQKLREDTGVGAVGSIVTVADNRGQPAAAAGAATDGTKDAGLGALFRKSFIFIDYLDWPTRTEHQASVSLSYQPSDLYSRLSGAQRIVLGGRTLGEWAVVALAVIAGLFLIIQFVALIMGLALARSMTSSIHEMFMGTERVRQGDFAHRIDIQSKDQLGELAQSFNDMTRSIEGLLQTAAEKKRLQEELRIARQIQMSLLPRGPLSVPGLGITALCVPAREVGGDYYDFFPLPQDRLGVLIADVAGKGTSAALYMAELKGVVLALSQRYESPRELLIEVNRIISENLDSRSFITVTYAVFDLQQRVMTYCRAGHTPLVILQGGSNTSGARVLTPSGMVLGLRIDGAAGKFEELLEEERIDLGTGDVIVLYTDGITEAMNANSDLFGESRLSRLVEEHGHLNSGELRERILREIEAFVGGADQHDDMTMILLKVEHAVAASDRVAV